MTSGNFMDLGGNVSMFGEMPGNQHDGVSSGKLRVCELENGYRNS